jgi:hypothetical protein
MIMCGYSKIARALSVTALVCAVTTALGAGGVALAGVTKPGQNGATKNSGLHQPVHGPGSSHNPIVWHPPLHGPGSSHNPIVWHPPVHGPGSSHNPIVWHPPLHGAGSSHNPIVVPPDCNDPNTLCRRP